MQLVGPHLSGVAQGVPGPRCPQEFQGGPRVVQSTTREAQRAPRAPQSLEKIGAPLATDGFGNTLT
eukprot:3643777-Pyramimonas_sp.AAC.1